MDVYAVTHRRRSELWPTSVLKVVIMCSDMRWKDSSITERCNERFRRETANGTITLSYRLNKLNFQNSLLIGNTKSNESPWGSFSS